MEIVGGKNLFQLIQDGDWPMYPIILLFVITLTITLERLIVIFIQNMKLRPDRFLLMFEKSFKKNEGDKFRTVDEMLQIAQKKGGVCGDVMVTAMLKFKDGVAKKMNPIEIRNWMTVAVEERALVEMPQLESHLGALAVIANVATLMGLFGTVFGMIDSFTAMGSSAGGVKADEMAKGIAAALVCTLGGLCVAIPALIIYNAMKSFIEGFVLQVQEAVTKVIDFLAS